EDAPAHVEARAVAWAVPRALDAIPVHDAAHVRAHGRALPEPAIGLAIDGQSLLAAAYDGRATGRDLIARIQLPALEIFGESRDRGRALLRDLECGVERLPSWIEYGGPDVVLFPFTQKESEQDGRESSVREAVAGVARRVELLLARRSADEAEAARRLEHLA